MSGTEKREGFRERLASGRFLFGAERVFDLDSVTLLSLITAMNAGLDVPGRKGDTIRLQPSSFHPGCVVSPFKQLESELVPQYLKLLRKAREVPLFLANRGLRVPVIGNVYLLNRTVYEMFHRGDIPGCVVSDALPELAAKQAAAFRSLGFAGAYLGGMAKAEDFEDVIARSEKYTEAAARAFAREIQFAVGNEFYLYERDPETGLGDPAHPNPAHLRALADPPRTANGGFTGGSSSPGAADPRMGCANAATRRACGSAPTSACDIRGRSKRISAPPPVFFDAGLEGSSSWANFYLGRDHRAVAAGDKAGAD